MRRELTVTHYSLLCQVADRQIEITYAADSRSLLIRIPLADLPDGQWQAMSVSYPQSAAYPFACFNPGKGLVRRPLSVDEQRLKDEVLSDLDSDPGLDLLLAALTELYLRDRSAYAEDRLHTARIAHEEAAVAFDRCQRSLARQQKRMTADSTDLSRRISQIGFLVDP